MNATRDATTARAVLFADAKHETRDHRRTTQSPRIATSALARRAAPATCGEFVQGAIEGRDFFVNCPIDCFAFATVRPIDRPGLHVRRPENHTKVRLETPLDSGAAPAATRTLSIRL